MTDQAPVTCRALQTDWPRLHIQSATIQDKLPQVAQRGKGFSRQLAKIVSAQVKPPQVPELCKQVGPHCSRQIAKFVPPKAESLQVAESCKQIAPDFSRQLVEFVEKQKEPLQLAEPSKNFRRQLSECVVTQVENSQVSELCKDFSLHQTYIKF